MKSAAEELSLHQQYEKNLRRTELAASAKSKSNSQRMSKSKRKKNEPKMEKPIGPTTSLVVQSLKAHDPMIAKLRATHKAGAREGKPTPVVRVPSNIIESPPSLKQRHQASAQDDGYKRPIRALRWHTALCARSAYLWHCVYSQGPRKWSTLARVSTPTTS